MILMGILETVIPLMQTMRPWSTRFLRSQILSLSWGIVTIGWIKKMAATMMTREATSWEPDTVSQKKPRSGLPFQGRYGFPPSNSSMIQTTATPI